MKWVVEALSGNAYGTLPDLPSFRSYPLYISLSSSSSKSMNSNTNITKSSTTSSSTTAFYSSNFVSVNSETIYVTAESEASDIASSNSKYDYGTKKAFPVVETPRIFTYEELILATSNFADSNRVAEVVFGTAYYGFLENGHHILVKRLGMKTCPALRSRFANEFQNLGRLRHRNLIPDNA
ncbi:receptor like protein kinase S.2 [Dorcoceras hygrometricum]|uniref:Receptor like protein kinase S.2 n=2 Tax=Dorcoceras hygrometricum TaxID=472368 RepID=A0A2Z7AKM5_9LAMI|nr:receptor like protein kinase S.2 [Dorcoceras hygrometricum]